MFCRPATHWGGHALLSVGEGDPRIAVTVESLTGCHPEHISDVTVCAIR
jgi:hypothetical protein